MKINMKCKKCGSKLEKEWNSCPICAEPIAKSNNVILVIGIVIGLIIIYNVINSINNFTLTGTSGVNKYLKQKHNKKFEDIVLVQAVKNPDMDLGCDGASFGTIKGKGDTEYYIAYSKEEDLEFIITYDTQTKEYFDNYEYSLKLRKTAADIYDETKSILNNFIEEIKFSPNLHDKYLEPINLSSTQDIIRILSKVLEGYPTKHQGSNYTGLYVYINMNALEFCKSEYNNIKKLNDFFVQLIEDSEFYSHIGLQIYTLDNIILEFNRLNAVRIYDSFGLNNAWGETIEEFIQR